MNYYLKKSQCIRRITLINNHNRNSQIVRIRLKECHLKKVKSYDLTSMLAFTAMLLLKYIFMFMFL